MSEKDILTFILYLIILTLTGSNILLRKRCIQKDKEFNDLKGKVENLKSRVILLERE